MDDNYERVDITAYLCDESKKLVHGKTYKSGETIYNEGECPKGIYFLEDGLVALTYISINGAESLLRVFTQGNIFGHRSLLASEAYHASAVTLKESRVLFVPKENAERVLRKNPELMMRVIKTMALDLKNAEIRLRDMTGKKVSGRIIESLIFLKHRNPEYSWTRREIGEFCGAKTETVSRVLGQLEKKSLIKKDGREIILLDEEGLLDLADGE